MKAIVMAGGKGTRMDKEVEKPLTILEDETFLERVTAAIRASDIEPVVAATLDTPETMKAAINLGCETIETPGKGYVSDIQFVLEELGLESALVVSSDLPFLTADIIKNVIEEYNRVGKPVCAVTSLKQYLKFGFQAPVTVNHNGEILVPVGVNVVEKTEAEDYFYITSGIETLNINTLEELDIAKKMIENG